MLAGYVLSCRRKVPIDYLRHILQSNAGVPDVVGVDEDDRAIVVASGAGVAQHHGRRESMPLDLGPERPKEITAAFAAAAPLPRRSAHENQS